MGIVLFEHNQTAYNAAVSMLKLTGRAAVIHPTGTGKSFLGFQLCEENRDKKICWISPSEYIFQTQIKNWQFACEKYNDNSKFYTCDEIDTKNFSKDNCQTVHVSTPQENGDYSNKGKEFLFPNLVFYTYAKLMRMDESALFEIKPDYIILDEFHRCGAKQWGSGVERLRQIYPKAKILGLSATSIRYLDNQRDMAFELFGGNIASELSLGEAIARGILPMPKYILSAYSYQKELQKYELRVQKTKSRAVRDTAEQQLEALRRALEMADGLEDIFAKHIVPKKDKNGVGTYGKYIVFCANYDHLNKMKELAGTWFAKVDSSPHIYIVYSEDQAAAREFEAFKADESRHLKLLYCIDMLNEGIHIDGVDGVILLRPTVSPIIYKQQIGRALAAGKRKTPIIFDIVINIENLFSIGAIEEEFRETVFSYRALGQEDKIVLENFQIIDEVQDCRKLFAQLNKTLGASWDAMYELAKEYYNQHGNLNVPKRYTTSEGYSLGAWIDTQRKVYAGKTAGNLNKEQIKKLSVIGMRWQNARESAWEKHYAEAEKYYKEHGDLLVGLQIFESKKNIDIKNTNKKNSDTLKLSLNSDKENCADKEDKENRDIVLGRWLAKMRAERKKLLNKEVKDNSVLTKERIARLNAIGMVWDTTDFIWEKYFTAAEQYYQKYGDLAVPSYYITPCGIRLGKWISNQRKNWNKYGVFQENAEIFTKVEGLTKQQEARLSDIGMDWNEKNYTTWEKSYQAAYRYWNEYGNLKVPSAYVTEDGYHLGRWIRRQRSLYCQIATEDGKKAQSQTAKRIKKLEQIGMIWKENDSWQERFELAKEYYKEHNNLDMPNNYIVNGVWLARWVREQRLRLMYTENESLKETKRLLTKEQKEQLSSIGIGENYKTKAELTWMQQYKEAKEYFCAHGNLSIPKRYVGTSGKNLGNWLRQQRQGRKNGTLKEQQIQMLDKVGMTWELEQPWQTGYEHAKQYFEKYKNLEVPNAYISQDGYRLGKWISNQRSAYKKREEGLNKEKIKKLQEIGMIWDVFEHRRSKEQV